MPLFVHLGTWQSDKAERRAAEQAGLEARGALPALALGGAAVEPEALHQRKVIARGRFEPRHQFLLDNQVHRGRAGFHVLTPLALEGAEARVLVNRGWVPFSGDRSRLPEVATPEEVVEVRGQAVLPPQKFYELSAPAAGWQPVWQNLDLARYRAAVPFPVLPVVLRLDPDSPAGGFVREWPRPDDKVGMHRGYALQWYALAALLAAAWLYSCLRKPDASSA